jgi:hypothetical protein
MMPLQNLTVEQLRKLIAIKEQIETFDREIEEITGGDGSVGPAIPKRRGRKKMSFAERGRIAAAARWGKVRAEEGEVDAPMKRRKVSAAGRARMAAAQRARWANARAGGKNRL